MLWAACSSSPQEKESVGGTFVGYTYSETPIVEASVPVEYAYTIKFRAYDLGEEARFVVYAQREQTGEYYTGVIRLAIEDPDGNAFTYYHSAEAEPIDYPIVWKRRTTGTHSVEVSFPLLADKDARARFDVPLNREPVSPLIIGGIVGALALGLAVLVWRIRKGQGASVGLPPDRK
jgi:hypothetical protein